MARTQNLDQVEFYEDLLFRSGSDKREKSIYILENNPNHAAFLHRGLVEIEELLPGDSEVCKVVMNIWGFGVVLGNRPIGYPEMLGQSLQNFYPKPDMIIISFLAKHDADLVTDLLKCLEEWTEDGAVVLFTSSRADKDFGVPCFPHYDPQGIRYIADWITPDETIM